MWEAFKTLPETVKGWQDNRQQLYSVAVSLVAALVIAAATTGNRPSDFLAMMARGLGLTPVAGWFGPEAPPFLAQRVNWLHSGMLSAALLLLAVMVIVPLRRSWRDDNDIFPLECFRLVGSPAAGTVWVLLLVAAQQGDILPALQGWNERIVVGSIWVVGGLIGGGTFYFLARRSWLGALLRPMLILPAVVVYRLFIGFAMALLAIALAAVMFPLSIVAWMCALEADDRRNARSETERNRIAQAPEPTGAVMTPTRAG